MGSKFGPQSSVLGLIMFGETRSTRKMVNSAVQLDELLARFSPWHALHRKFVATCVSILGVLVTAVM